MRSVVEASVPVASTRTAQPQQSVGVVGNGCTTECGGVQWRHCRRLHAAWQLLLRQ